MNETEYYIVVFRDPGSGDHAALYHSWDNACAAEIKWCRDNWHKDSPPPEDDEKLLEQSDVYYADIHVVPFTDEPPQKVVIEVYGGIADVTSCPPGVDIEIIDHDNLAAESTS